MSEADSMQYMPFSLGEYVGNYNRYLNVKNVGTVPSNGKVLTIYVARKSGNWDVARGAYIGFLMHWVECGAIFQIDHALCVDVHSICCIEKYGYLATMYSIVSRY